MTTTSIIGRVRRLIQDNESPYHWSDAQLKVDVQSAIRALYSVRPETRYVNCSLVDEIILPTLSTDTIPIEDRYEECLSYYAAYLAYSDDCTDPVSKQLADDFLAKFNVFARQ